MTRNTIMLFVFFLIAVLAVLLLTNDAGAAELVHKMKNGVSFSYPSDWEAVKSTKGDLEAVLIAPDKNTSISIIITEGVLVNSLPADKNEWQRRMSAQKIELHSFKKDSVAGREAIRTEYTIERKNPIQSLSVQFDDGGNGGNTGNLITISLSSTDTEAMSRAESVFEGILASLTLK